MAQAFNVIIKFNKSWSFFQIVCRFNKPPHTIYMGKNIKKSMCCVYLSHFFLLFNPKKSGPDIFIPVISFATADKVGKILSLYKNVLSS